MAALFRSKSGNKKRLSHRKLEKKTRKNLREQSTPLRRKWRETTNEDAAVTKSGELTDSSNLKERRQKHQYPGHSGAVRPKRSRKLISLQVSSKRRHSLGRRVGDISDEEPSSLLDDNASLDDSSDEEFSSLLDANASLDDSFSRSDSHRDRKGTKKKSKLSSYEKQVVRRFKEHLNEISCKNLFETNELRFEWIEELKSYGDNVLRHLVQESLDEDLRKWAKFQKLSGARWKDSSFKSLKKTLVRYIESQRPRINPADVELLTYPAGKPLKELYDKKIKLWWELHEWCVQYEQMKVEEELNLSNSQVNH